MSSESKLDRWKRYQTPVTKAIPKAEAVTPRVTEPNLIQQEVDRLAEIQKSPAYKKAQAEWSAARDKYGLHAKETLALRDKLLSLTTPARIVKVPPEAALPRAVPAARVAPGVAKQPWQMTQREWAARGEQLTAEHYAIVEELSRRMGPSALDTNSPVGRHASQEALNILRQRHNNPNLSFSDLGGFGHRIITQRALSEGKPVPAEVLADYPDLAARRER